MRLVGLCLVMTALSVCSCSRKSEANNTKPPETMGQRAGRAAYWAAKQAGAAAQKTGKELQEGAKQVHKGWTEASHDDRNKPKAKPDDRDR